MSETCWNVIISALSAFVTFCAVVVAIWQTKYTNKKKLKLNSNITAQLIQDLTTGKINNTSYLFISLDITNTGNRNVVIEDWGIKLTKKFSFQIIANKQQILPKEITIENKLNLKTTLIDLRNALKANLKEVKNKNRRLKIYVTDSSGKKYYTKIKKSIKKIIEMKDDELIIKLNNK